MPRSLRNGRDGERPPRRFAPPLLCKEGNVVPNNFVKKIRTYSLVTQRRAIHVLCLRASVSLCFFRIHNLSQFNYTLDETTAQEQPNQMKGSGPIVYSKSGT